MIFWQVFGQVTGQVDHVNHVRRLESLYGPCELALMLKNLIKLLLDLTLIHLLRIPSLGRIGSTKLVLPKWQNIDILNRGIRVVYLRFKVIADV